MATKPKPKPEPEPEPEPDEETTDASDGVTLQERLLKALEDRLDALFTSQTSLIERVEKLEERADAPPIRLGKRP
jgi:hypothetical protein